MKCINMDFNCGDCRYYSDGHCRYSKTRVKSSESCDYFDPTYEVKLPPDGRERLAAVSAKKHVTYFIKSKRGATDPELKELRKKLNLPVGFRLVRCESSYEKFRGMIYVKNSNTGETVRWISAEEIIMILNQ